MTWEWVTVIASCLAFVEVAAWIVVKVFLKEIDLEAAKVHAEQLKATYQKPVSPEILAAVEKIKADHERIEKLAEETKKMLSNANLARATGMIGGHR